MNDSSGGQLAQYEQTVTVTDTTAATVTTDSLA